MKLPLLKHILLGLAVTVGAAPTQATDLARTPLAVHGAVAPNVIFGMDDSSSMDWELLIPSENDGVYKSDKTYSYLFSNNKCTSISQSAGTWSCNNNIKTYELAPTDTKHAHLRSVSFNPIYYDPKIAYKPWASATINGAIRSYSNANPSTAPLHPLDGSKVNSIDLKNSGQAQYWNKEACTPDNTTCVLAPDGSTLKNYKIIEGTNRYPSGRTYTEELQNFANWFTYYRKRKLMLAGAMGHVLDKLNGMRVGLIEFNNYDGTVEMYNTDFVDNSANAKVVAGKFYSNLAAKKKGDELTVALTPTSTTLSNIGRAFNEQKGVIEAACQRNAAFIVTDGYADATSISAPAYNKNIYGNGSPYSPTADGTLADLALAYYSIQLREKDFPAGLSPTTGDEETSVAADKNKNLHMNTYAITLGASGKLWPGISDPFSLPSIPWTKPTINRSPESIDDLWHATINGRGRMFLATNPDETAKSMQAALDAIQRQSGSQGAVTFSTVNLKEEDSTAYVGSYSPKGYSGELLAYPVDPATGKFAETPTWSAGKLLVAKDWTKRIMATFGGSKGIPFTTTSAGTLLKNIGLTTTENAVNYFRGDRSLEISSLRERTGIMGAVLSAEAVVDSALGVIYLASGEGVVHAFDKSTGEELWAYVPGFTLPDIGDQLSKTWKFQTMLDATPQLAKVGDKRFLVGSRGSAGAGVYALDVTKAKEIKSDSELAAAVAWEFPNENTPASTKNLVGALTAKPLVVNTPTGTVVVLASGYFPNTGGTGDGKARIFVLDATSGELKSTIEAPIQPGDVGEAGLSALSGLLETNGAVRHVYGGDERGHLWRFDLQKSTADLLMTLTDSSGASLPITAAPELARINNRRMVFVGTGRFLGESDFKDSNRHSFFALWDNGTTISNRNMLASREITKGADGFRTVSGPSVDWTSQRGWVVTLPQGERAHTDPTMGAGVIVFTTNSPSMTACSAASALYVAEASSGLAMPISAFPVGVQPWYGRNLGSSLASDPVLTRQSTGEMGITTRQSDGSQETRTLNMGKGPAPRKTAWRELLR